MILSDCEVIPVTYCHLSRYGCLVFTHVFLLNECLFERINSKYSTLRQYNVRLHMYHKYFAPKHTLYYMQVTQKTRTLYFPLYFASMRVLDIPPLYFPDNSVSRAARSRYPSCLLAVAECLCCRLFR